MNSHKKVEDIADYFKKQIVDGNYEILEVKSHFTEIRIDEDFEFNLWTANDQPECMATFHNDSLSGMLKKYMKFTPEEQSKIWDVLKVRIDTYNKEVGIKEKEAKIKELQEELEKIKA